MISVFLKKKLITFGLLALMIAGLGGYAAYQKFSADELAVTLTPVKTTISSGRSHSLTIDSYGNVWASGNNASGQLGDNTNTNSLSPVEVLTVTDAVSVAAGNSHSLALKSDGTVWAWGDNKYGQLGNEKTTNSSVPVQVEDLTDVVSISAGSFNSFAVKSNGWVYAWGRGIYGQLGNGTYSDRNKPISVVGISNIVSVAAGQNHTLALKSDGTLYAWGDNSWGQLGDTTLGSKIVVPHPIGAVGAVKAIAAGYSHSVAVKSDGTVWGCGWNYSGQLGDGTTAPRNSFTKVSNITMANVVGAGYDSSFASKADGTLWGWGNTQSVGTKNIPTLISGITDANFIAPGFNFTLAKQSTSQNVLSWGNNSSGQLGNGTTSGSTTPKPGPTPVACTPDPGLQVSVTETVNKAIPGPGSNPDPYSLSFAISQVEANITALADGTAPLSVDEEEALQLDPSKLTSSMKEDISKRVIGQYAAGAVKPLTDWGYNRVSQIAYQLFNIPPKKNGQCGNAFAQATENINVTTHDIDKKLNGASLGVSINYDKIQIYAKRKLSAQFLYSKNNGAGNLLGGGHFRIVVEGSYSINGGKASASGNLRYDTDNNEISTNWVNTF